MDRPNAERRAQSCDQPIQRVLAVICYWLLQKLSGLQDVLLSFSIFRKAAAYSLAPRCRQTVLKAVQTPSDLNAFEDLEYYISEDAQELLMHAALHGMLTAPVLQTVPSSFKLPTLGRILLQSPTKNSALYQESVASALAKRLNAYFLVLDDVLLTSVSKAAFGSSIDRPDHQEDLGKLLHFVLSIWFSGGKLCFVWDVIQRTCQAIKQPLVVFIKDAEHTVCGSYERKDAFQEAFGLRTSSLSPSEMSSAVLIAGCSLGDTGSDLTPQTLLAAKQLDESGGTAPPPPAGSTPAGHDDGLGPILPDLGSLLHADKPNARRILSKLFTTRVKLPPPPEGAAAAKHNAKIAEDADKLLAKNNHIAASGLAARAGLVAPPATSAIYTKRQLSVADWTKALAWAQSMQLISKVDQQRKARKQPAKAGPSSSGLQATAEQQQSSGQHKHSHSIRRVKSAQGSGGLPLESLPLLQASAHAPDLTQPPAANEKADKPRHDHRAAHSGNVEATTAAVPGDVPQQEHAPLQLSEGAMWYGLHMLERAGGPMRQHIMTENMYEQRLLPEVVNSDEAGGGFAEVGALSEAKDALREAVQLPLQHPRLFQKGSLARPCRGVLLFGPPGTGKTLLARAAAAECGASFLAIHPSTVASKWLGDGVRYMRAVFSLASKLSPCVLFIDEVDAMLAKRDSQREHEAHREIKNEFMAQWDGIRTGSSASEDRVMVLGATNRPQDLDEAVLRRFSRRIFCDLPNRKARREILDVILSGENMADDVSTASIADKTEGFSGSDLRQLCTAAAMCGIRDLMKATSKASKADAAGQKARTLAGKPIPARPAADATDVSTSRAQATGGIPVIAAGDSDATTSDAIASNPQADDGSRALTKSSTDAGTSGLSAETGADASTSSTPAEHVNGVSALATSPASSTTSTRGVASVEESGVSTAPQDRHASTAAKPSKGSKRDSALPTAIGAKRHKGSSEKDRQPSGIPQGRAQNVSAAADQAKGVTGKVSLPGAQQEEASKSGIEPETVQADKGQNQEDQQQEASSSSSTFRAGPQWLLARFYDVAAAADHKANQELRPITNADFEKARQQITPSTNPDSMVISELKQWNSTYGESGSRGYRQHLSYYT